MDIEALRTGGHDAPVPVVLEGLANFFGISKLYFEPNESVARQAYEALRLMSAAKQGKVGRVRARGMSAEGLPADVLSILNDLAGELEEGRSKHRHPAPRPVCRLLHLDSGRSRPGSRLG